MVYEAFRLFLYTVAIVGGALSAGVMVLFLGLSVARAFATPVKINAAVVLAVLSMIVLIVFMIRSGVLSPFL